MLTELSLWGIYIASYFIDYLVILGISIWKKVSAYNAIKPAPTISFWQYCNRKDYFTWAILIGLIIFSLACSHIMKEIPMNTRISDKPNDNVIWEIFSYVLAQVLTVLTILFTDYWLVISLVIVAVTGIIFVHSRKIQHSPLFIIPMGYNIFKCEKCIAITNYSMDGLRLAIESNPDGVEARELEEGVFLIRKK